MSATPVELTVLLLVRDRAEAACRLLGSLAGQGLPRTAFEVVVVDDGSTDGLRERLAAFAPTLPVVYAGQQAAGRMSARMHGLYRARGLAVLQLEATDVAPPGLLEAHRAHHAAEPDRRAGLVGPLLPGPALRADAEALAWHLASPVLRRAGRGGREGPVDLRACWGGRWSAKRALLVELHGPHVGRCTGGHDLELLARLRDEGLRLRWSEGAACFTEDRPGPEESLARARALGVAAARLAGARRRWRVRPWLGLAPGWRAAALAPWPGGPRAAALASLSAGLREGARS